MGRIRESYAWDMDLAIDPQSGSVELWEMWIWSHRLTKGELKISQK
jgi:hypothetical protein